MGENVWEEIDSLIVVKSRKWIVLATVMWFATFVTFLGLFMAPVGAGAIDLRQPLLKD